MDQRLLICTDLDRTLIPNGPQPESPGAREHFARLCAHPQVTLVYVSGRHRALVQQAITNYSLPMPEWVIGDVGSSIYHLENALQWRAQTQWEHDIGQDWNGQTSEDLKLLLQDLSDLRLQEHSKQNRYKLSYYVPMYSDRNLLGEIIETRLQAQQIKSRQIWSVDEPAGIGLLDILPASASKYHAIQALMQLQGFDESHTVFCGDSGNDIEVLASPIPAVLVANSQPEVRELAHALAAQAGQTDRLYIAQGNFNGMNGNYSAGMLEGIAHYHPCILGWAGLTAGEDA